MFSIILASLLLLTPLVHGVHDERDDSLVDDLATLMLQLNSDSEDFAFDVDDTVAEDELRAILKLNGYNGNKLLADGLWSGLWGLLTGGGTKWAAINFAKQISCYQGRSTKLISAALYAYKKYNGYGCYCGSGFYNGNFLDATDGCCRKHDKCYSRAQKKYELAQGCHTYSTAYAMKCCKSEKMTRCTDSGPSAGRALCECDQAMAKCIAQKKVLSTYNRRLMRNRSQCKSTTPGEKAFSLSEIIASCKHVFKSRLKIVRQTIKSQGNCPARKKKARWW